MSTAQPIVSAGVSVVGSGPGPDPGTVQHTLRIPVPGPRVGDQVMLVHDDGNYVTATVTAVRADEVDTVSCARCLLAITGHDPGFCACKTVHVGADGGLW